MWKLAFLATFRDPSLPPNLSKISAYAFMNGMNGEEYKNKITRKK